MQPKRGTRVSWYYGWHAINYRGYLKVHIYTGIDSAQVDINYK